MDSEGLTLICTGFGCAEEDENGVVKGYTKSEYCLDNLKDLQRYLRRDDPQRRDVFKQVCRWNIVSRDLVPIVEHYQSDRNLVINTVKVLVFLTMPIDPSSDEIAQQIECLWDLKAAMTRNVTVTVIVSLLEDPLDHLERDAFTEDDWKLVQLVLTLFRNFLAIQEISLQQKASGSATQFLSLRDSFLELMFQESVMDIILVLTQHINDSDGYLDQDNLLLLEIFHYIFRGQDPVLIAKSSRKSSKVNEDITTSVDSLKSMMEDERKRRFNWMKNADRHSQFSGTFTCLAMDGSKTLYKGNPAFASGHGLLKVHKVQRGPLKRTAWDYESLSLAKDNLLELLYNFLNQFLSGGYNILMQSVFSDIIKEHEAIQKMDIIVFFQVAHFAIAFQHQKILIAKNSDLEDATSEATLDHGIVNDLPFQGGFCGPIAATVNEAMFFLVMSKWREAFEGFKETKDLKSLSTAGSLMKSMIRMLDLVLKLLPEDSKEPQIARILLYKIFYDQTEQGLTQFILNLFKSFDTHRQPKSDLADLLEIIHVVLRLMEKLQAGGTLRVSRKARQGRKKKTTKVTDEDENQKNVDNLTNEIRRPASESTGDSEIRKPSSAEELGCNSTARPDMPPLDPGHFIDDPSSIGSEQVDRRLTDLEHATEDSSDDDQAPTMYEADFNVSKLVGSFASNTVIHNLCWLLKFYKSNSAGINHYIICMLKRFCDDLELSPMLYQLSLLTTFYEILADQKSSMSKEYENIVQFLTKLVRKMLKMFKNQPFLFVDILFWKTRKECHYINAEALHGDLVDLKKAIRNQDGDAGLSNDYGGPIRKSIADSLGDDEADFLIPQDLKNQRSHSSSDEAHEKDFHKTRQSVGCRKRPTLNDINESDHNKGVSSHPEGPNASKRRKGSVFNQEQEAAIEHLYEKFKHHKKCNHLIANALDNGHNRYNAAQVSHKLRQLGLIVPKKRRSSEPGKLSSDNDHIETEQNDEKTLLEFKEGMKRKRSKLSPKNTVVNISQHKAMEQDNGFNEESSSMLEYVTSQHELDPVDTIARVVDTAALDGSLEDEPDDDDILQRRQKHELEDLIDSGDEGYLVQPTRAASRRSLKMVLDFEDEE